MHLPQRVYNPGMSLQHIDMEGVLRRLAERRIEDAMQEGKFDNLPGMGKPLDLEPLPANENARMLWWTLRIMRTHDIVPDEIRWRKAVDLMKGDLHRTRDEARVRSLVEQINELVFKLNTLGTNALSTGVYPVDLEAELTRLRERCTS